ncbi:MAG: glutamine--fructose-6-phosphate aminotransferase, partial [Planctomycetaceae bacterium]|nr:glutamine--fructose-6-phosphate aminotransferase [Planctomycetaceae bacterium]
MCGIVAVVGMPGAVGIVLDGLRSLEYRGYDSAGIAWPENGRFSLHRAAGRVADLEKLLGNGLGGGQEAAIGHTRWATHGPPVEKNAHPQLSHDGVISVVHNGIIDNFAALRDELRRDGITCMSDTDTEIVACLIAREYEKSGAPGDLVGAVEA